MSRRARQIAAARLSFWAAVPSADITFMSVMPAKAKTLRTEEVACSNDATGEPKKRGAAQVRQRCRGETAIGQFDVRVSRPVAFDDDCGHFSDVVWTKVQDTARVLHEVSLIDDMHGLGPLPTSSHL